MGRNDPCFCGSGKKIKKCHDDINENSILAALFAKYAYFDRLVETYTIDLCSPCKQGCIDCCYGYFFISEVEYVGINYFLAKHEINRSAITDRAAQVLNEVKNDYPEEYNRLQTLSYSGTCKNPSYLNFFEDGGISALKHPCPFLDVEERKCTIYPVRPFICRGYGQLKQFGGCIKCTQDVMSSATMPKEILVQDIDVFRLSKNSRPIIPRPYPIADWIQSFGDKNLIRYSKAVNESRESYVKALVRK